MEGKLSCEPASNGWLRKVDILYFNPFEKGVKFIQKSVRFKVDKLDPGLKSVAGNNYNWMGCCSKTTKEIMFF
ncbi:hypothetical protein EFI48_14965 [Aeromonas veronii]|uniref:Uncharacterized protein n=1 Tax=Aeromonas veronii TaxID=654 RepID=A0AAN1QGW9_AERVE|nr:hypothetical protein EFI48_14965 [Aeromonas veronii]